MKVEVLFFGVLTELMKTKRLTVHDSKTTDSLLEKLNAKNDDLSSKSFKIAVNNKLIHQNTTLDDGDEIALMPPFAGG